MLDYQKRVVQERAELSEKIDKLRTFLASGAYGVSEDEYRRLRRQYLHMMAYMEVLDERIVFFKS